MRFRGEKEGWMERKRTERKGRKGTRVKTENKTVDQYRYYTKPNRLPIINALT